MDRCFIRVCPKCNKRSIKILEQGSCYSDFACPFCKYGATVIIDTYLVSDKI